MEDRPDILHHLQQHETTPPAELAKKVMSIPEQEEAAIFQRLREYERRPPAHLTAVVRSRRIITNRSRRTLAYKITAAIITVIGGIVLWRFVAEQKSITEKILGVRTAPQSRSAGQSGAVPPSSALSANPPTNASDSSALAILHSLPLQFVLDGERYPMTENSPLTTFIGFHYPALKKYLFSKKAENGWRIHLDQYTSINLSRAMITTLRKLYVTRSDGSPAREARRTRDRLEKWTIQDKKQFDPRFITSPLDPIDLADFLFPPLFSFGRHSHGVAPSPVSPPTAPSPPVNKSSNKNTSLTISYAVAVISDKTSTGVGETYNGGLQTLFDNGHEARLRLATLMRIQSVFMSRKTNTFTILPESANPQHPVTMTAGQWAAYNHKYAGATCSFPDDTIRILGYPCKKAIILLHHGRSITAWYTPSIQNSAQALLQPAFANIPGLVLQYEHTLRRKTVSYTAINLNRQPIDASIFLP